MNHYLLFIKIIKISYHFFGLSAMEFQTTHTNRHSTAPLINNFQRILDKGIPVLYKMVVSRQQQPG